MYKNVPINLRRIMSEKNVGIKALALRTNIEYTKITHIRKDDGDKWVTQELLIKLANALEIEPDQLTKEPKQVEIDQLPKYLKNYAITHKLTPAVFAHRLGFPKDLIEELQSPNNDIAIEAARELDEQQFNKLGHSMGIRIIPRQTLTDNHDISFVLDALAPIQKVSDDSPAKSTNSSDTETESESDNSTNLNPSRKRQRPGSIMTTPRLDTLPTASPRQQASSNATTLFDDIPMLATIPTQLQHCEPTSQHPVPLPFPTTFHHTSVSQTSSQDSEIASLREQLTLVEQHVKQLSTKATSTLLPTTQQLSSEQEVAKLRKQVEKLTQKLKKPRTHKTMSTSPEHAEMAELRSKNEMLEQRFRQLGYHPETLYPTMSYPPFGQPPYPMPWLPYPPYGYLPAYPQPSIPHHQNGYLPPPMYLPSLQHNVLNISDALMPHTTQGSPSQLPAPNTPDTARPPVSTQTPLFGQTGSPTLFSSPFPSMSMIPLPSAYQNMQAMAAQSPNHTHSPLSSAGIPAEATSPHRRHKHHKHKSSTKQRHASPSPLIPSVSPASRSALFHSPGGPDANLNEGNVTSSPLNPGSSVFK